LGYTLDRRFTDNTSKLLLNGNAGTLVVDIKDIENPELTTHIPLHPDEYAVHTALYTDNYMFTSSPLSRLLVYTRRHHQDDYALIFDDRNLRQDTFLFNMDYKEPYLFMNVSHGTKVYNVKNNFQVVDLHGKHAIDKHWSVNTNDLIYKLYTSNELEIYSVLNNEFITAIPWTKFSDVMHFLASSAVKMVDDLLYVQFFTNFHVYRVEYQQATLVNGLAPGFSIAHFILTDNQVLFQQWNPRRVRVYDRVGNDFVHNSYIDGIMQNWNSINITPENYVIFLHDNRVVIRDIEDVNIVLFDQPITHTGEYHIRFIQNGYIAFTRTLNEPTMAFIIYRYDIENNSLTHFHTIIGDDVNAFNGIITKNAQFSNTSIYYAIIDDELVKIGDKHDFRNVHFTFFYPERNKMVQVAGSGIHVYDFEFRTTDCIFADFIAEPLSGDAPLTVQFTDMSAGDVYSWAWDFDGNGVVDSTEQNPSFTYTEPGLYTITLSINDGETYITKQDMINVDPVDINDEIEIPTITALIGNYPNPFNPETIIQFTIGNESLTPTLSRERELSASQHVTIHVYNIRGQRVRTLVNDNHSPGVYEVIWNGRDDNNNMVGSGIYFYRLTAGDIVETRRMMLLK
jgi:PKD repeat protein